jgi:hypothetical protein
VDRQPGRRNIEHGLAQATHPTGYYPDGRPFDRRGRATISFTRPSIGDPWIATHTHMSLFRGTPDVSHGDKPAKS